MNLEIIRVIIAVIGWLFWAGCVAANGSVLIKWLTQKKTGSNIPFIGGLVGCIACFVSPWSVVRPYWWFLLILDTSYLMAMFGIIRMVFRSKDDRKDS